MLTQHIRESLQVTPGPFPDFWVGPGDEAILLALHARASPDDCSMGFCGFDKIMLKMALTEATMFRSPELKPFLLEDVKRTGNQLGVGSYGAVEELRVGGAACAGKKLHETLLDPRDEGVRCMLERFASECQLMANLRHPHVVQFLGLCFLPGATAPFLVMERMHTSLDKVCDLTL